jgi:hypothetical protein
MNFYPDAKDCNYHGTPYVLLPNARFHEVVTTGSTHVEHIDRLLHGTWRAELNGNLSAIGWHKYRKNYWRALSVNYVIDAVGMSCGDSQLTSVQHGSVPVDWKAELAKAKAGIEKNPKSAFWHNQAGVAYAGTPRPAEIRFIGDESQDGDDRAHQNDEAVLLSNAAQEHDWRLAPDQHPCSSVERPSEF